MPASATFTMGFSGFASDSLWFPPLSSQAGDIGDELFRDASLTKERAAGMLAVGCEQAAQTHPELAEPLRALSRAALELDFFDYEPNMETLGWFRLVANAPGATPEALSACEEALAKSRAPLLSAKVEGAILAFGSGLSDEAPPSFVCAAQAASAKVSTAFESTPLQLADADIIRFRSADGSRQIVVCAASCARPSDSLADIKTYAKLAQAGIEARRTTPSTPELCAFFDAMDKALGASPDSPPLGRHGVRLPPGLFFHAPASVRMVDISGLPSEGFDQGVKASLPALAKRFGALAAGAKGFDGAIEAQAPTVGQLAALSGLFAKLPMLEPKTSSATAGASPAAPGPTST